MHGTTNVKFGSICPEFFICVHK